MLKTTTKKAKGNLKAYIRSIYRNKELSDKIERRNPLYTLIKKRRKENDRNLY